LGYCQCDYDPYQKKALRLAAVNIVSNIPYLDGIDPEDIEDVQLAVDLLQIIRGAQRLGLEKLDYKQLSAKEFDLVAYLSAQIDSHGSKGK